jgi:hypothetical protein
MSHHGTLLRTPTPPRRTPLAFGLLAWARLPRSRGGLPPASPARLTDKSTPGIGPEARCRRAARRRTVIASRKKFRQVAPLHSSSRHTICSSARLRPISSSLAARTTSRRLGMARSAAAYCRDKCKPPPKTTLCAVPIPNSTEVRTYSQPSDSSMASPRNDTESELSIWPSAGCSTRDSSLLCEAPVIPTSCSPSER